MAAKKTTTVNKKKDIRMLEDKIAKLEEENQRLKSVTGVKKDKKPYEWLRKSSVVFLLTLSIVTFMLFNLASWTKNTVLNTDTFVATMQPVITEPAVQKVIQDEITTKLFEKVDLESELQNALPENVAFISGPLASQVESFTYNKVGEAIASPQIYALWGVSLERIHSRVIGYIQNDEKDGVLTVNDIYASISERVSSDSKISFLFNKQLPEKFGTITLAEISWLPEAIAYVNALNIAPIIFLLTSILSFILALMLAMRKRFVTGVYLILSIIMMLSTLAALTAGNLIINQEAQAKYADAAQAIYSTITAPLQTRTLGYVSVMAVALLVIILTSKNNFIAKSRNYLDAHIMHFADKILPTVASVPSWIKSFVSHIAIISWTVFIVVFVVIGLQFPPNYTQVKFGFFVGTILVLLLYILRVVVVTLNKHSQK